MNVVMLLTNPCNPDIRVIKEAKYIISKGHNVTILCWDRNKDTDLLEEETKYGIKFIRFRVASVPGTGYKQLLPFFKYAKKCRQYINKNRIDIVHCHDLDGYVTYRLLSKRKIPYVWDMHENFIRGKGIKKKILKSTIQSGVKKSVYCLYVTRDVSRQLDEKAQQKMLLLRNYPDEEMVSYHEKASSDVFRIGYHGGVRRQIPQFAALFEACKDMEDVRIDINGKGIDFCELKRMSQIYKNVFVHGAYDGMKMTNELYRNTDMLFCGYDSNNINYQGDTEVIKFYEAIVTATPMLMTSGLGMAKKVEDMQIGFVVDTTNSKEIKQAVEMIKTDRTLLEKWRRNMVNVSDDYKWSEAVKILDNIY